MEIPLTVKEGYPGAVHFGNFINYYQFNPPENRLKLLPKHIWGCAPFYGLDLGCNSGDLTIGLYNFFEQFISEKYLLGIDIDPILIERANIKNNCDNIKFICDNFMIDNDSIKNYLKYHNIEKFNAVFCFSLSMWIHLYYGDKGLEDFLKKLVQLGNIIVIEPQSWKNYKSAVKRLKQINSEFNHFKTIMYRNNIKEKIIEILLSLGTEKLWESEQTTDWGRNIFIFKVK